MKDRETGSECEISEDKVTPRGRLPKLEKPRIKPLKRSKMKLSSPAEREAFAAFKAGKMKPIVRKTFPKEVVDERLGQMADHIISRFPKKYRASVAREWLIDRLRRMLAPPQLLQDVTPREPADGK